MTVTAPSCFFSDDLWIFIGGATLKYHAGASA
jgi:hypothetical protein